MTYFIFYILIPLFIGYLISSIYLSWLNHKEKLKKEQEAKIEIQNAQCMAAYNKLKNRGE